MAKSEFLIAKGRSFRPICKLCYRFRLSYARILHFLKLRNLGWFVRRASRLNWLDCLSPQLLEKVLSRQTDEKSAIQFLTLASRAGSPLRFQVNKSIQSLITQDSRTNLREWAQLQLGPYRQGDRGTTSKQIRAYSDSFISPAWRNFSRDVICILEAGKCDRIDILLSGVRNEGRALFPHELVLANHLLRVLYSEIRTISGGLEARAIRVFHAEATIASCLDHGASNPQLVSAAQKASLLLCLAGHQSDSGPRIRTKAFFELRPEPDIEREARLLHGELGPWVRLAENDGAKILSDFWHRKSLLKGGHVLVVGPGKSDLTLDEIEEASFVLFLGKKAYENFPIPPVSFEVHVNDTDLRRMESVSAPQHGSLVALPSGFNWPAGDWNVSVSPFVPKSMFLASALGLTRALFYLLAFEPGLVRVVGTDSYSSSLSSSQSTNSHTEYLSRELFTAHDLWQEKLWLSKLAKSFQWIEFRGNRTAEFI